MHLALDVRLAEFTLNAHNSSARAKRAAKKNAENEVTNTFIQGGEPVEEGKN